MAIKMLADDSSTERFNKRKNALIKLINRQYQHALRRMQHCETELLLCLKWEDHYHTGVLLQANFYRYKQGMTEINVVDWLDNDNQRMLFLDSSKPLHEQIQLIFKQSKKRQTGIPHLKKQLEQRVSDCRQLKACLDSIEQTMDETVLLTAEHKYLAPRRQKEAKLKIILPYREFLTAKGLVIRVGKGAKSNDQLTFRYAKGSDWWFHVRDYPGSHVVLVVAKSQLPDEESIHDAMLLALAYSKAQTEKEAEIVVTQCKQVHRCKGILGKVQLGQHKVMRIKQDAQRLAAIKKMAGS